MIISILITESFVTRPLMEKYELFIIIINGFYILLHSKLVIVFVNQMQIIRKQPQRESNEAV